MCNYMNLSLILETDLGCEMGEHTLGFCEDVSEEGRLLRRQD